MVYEGVFVRTRSVRQCLAHHSTSGTQQQAISTAWTTSTMWNEYLDISAMAEQTSNLRYRWHCIQSYCEPRDRWLLNDERERCQRTDDILYPRNLPPYPKLEICPTIAAGRPTRRRWHGVGVSYPSFTVGTRRGSLGGHVQVQTHMRFAENEVVLVLGHPCETCSQDK